MTITKYNDYELLYLMRRNNEKALEILFEKYRLYLYYKLKRFNFSRDFIEEMVQECLIEMSNSIKRYDENRNILFFTFVDTIFERKINKILIKYYRDKEIVTYCIDKENRKFNEGVCEYEHMEMLQRTKENFDKLIPKLLIKEQLVLKEVMINKKSISEYVKENGATHKQVYNQIQSIRNKYVKYCTKKNKSSL
ncbi:MAG: hypothetical protein R3Y05_04265 [bacterium]